MVCACRRGQCRETKGKREVRSNRAGPLERDRSMRTAITTGAVLIGLAASCVGQPLLRLPMPPDPGNRIVIRADANLVLVPVTVTDQRGAIVPDLQVGDFRLTENNLAQTLVSFSRETAPVSLGVVIDLSGSMASKMDRLRVPPHSSWPRTTHKSSAPAAGTDSPDTATPDP